MTVRAAVIALHLLLLAGAVSAQPPKGAGRLAFSELQGWSEDDHAAAFGAFRIGCQAKFDAAVYEDQRGKLATALSAICRHAETSPPANARRFFEAHFEPWPISSAEGGPGFFTGYYEPVVAGSRVKTASHQTPLYRRPADLVPLSPPDPGGALANGGDVVRRIDGRDLPYWTRAEIEDGALAGRGDELVWLADPVDAFFIQIQGSARIALPDGTVMRINYDGHNGHRYYPVGRNLIERGLVAREDMSLQKIRDYMHADLEAGRQLRRLNPSYVFFRQTPPHPLGEGPLGAQNVPLTAGRSIAVDKRRHVYGLPVWIETELPRDDSRETLPLRRLTVAQDTGSAIVGPARADIYFGHGDVAAREAGSLKHHGRFVLLLPKGHQPPDSLVRNGEVK